MLEFYEEIRKRADIVEVISEYLDLKREGSNYKAICPFHGDTDPSLSVSPSRQIWKCFGCGKGGDVIKFVSEYEGISYFEAAKLLAQKSGIPVPTVAKKRSPYEEALFKVLNFYEENLPKFRYAKDYLLKVRKVLPEWIEEFRLGFSPTGEALVEFAKREGIFETLRALGHIVEGKRGPIDIFWKRVTIPIFDAYGRLRGFAGRRMDNYKPKYLNSKNSEWFSKELALFGIDRAKSYAKDRGRLILVEGFFDVIRLHSLGFGEAVATLGTVLTEGQIKIIRKYAPKVYLIPDGDKSGLKAAIENAKKLFQYGLDPYLVFLPNVDPDEFLKDKGNIKTFRSSLEKAPHFVRWYLKQLDKLPIENRVNKLSELIKLIKQIKDPIKKELWLNEIEGTKMKSPKGVKRSHYAKKAIQGHKKGVSKIKKGGKRFKGK